MELNPGSKLGPYEIVSPLGKGGMGEVWRARDSRLGRDVAVKISDAQFTDRFEKEARAIAALNHPNICTLFDVGPNYLVMELIEGPTLGDRIHEGAIPLEEALGIARQIADALEAAHEKGIVHRDLKPGNVKIRPDGSVKVLDFGLATDVFSESQLSGDSPTLMHLPTQMGVILGTAAYMAPEQARGKVVDKRADIWSFGVVLHEMLTGKRLFEGEDLTETLASVVKSEPDISAVPPQVKRLLMKCLQKDPKKRLRDIGDWTELLEEERPAATSVSPQKSSLWWQVALAAALLALAALGILHLRQPQGIPAATVHVTLDLPKDRGTAFMALSPDGQQLAITLLGKLMVRALASDQYRTLPGTDLARAPFWSADGRYIAFYAETVLKYVTAGGGPPQEICRGASQGGTWNQDNVILVSGPNGSIMKAGLSGGCSPLPGDPSIRRRWPEFLPDGKHFLYRGAPVSLETEGTNKTGVYVASLDDPANGKRLLPDDTNAAFAPGDSKHPGYLLFVRDDALVAQAFDPESLQLSGEVFRIADSVSADGIGRFNFAARKNGVLIYGTGLPRLITQLTELDRAGKVLGSPGPALRQSSIALSPDERRLAVQRWVGQNSELWQRDAAGGNESRFLSKPLGGVAPVWSPDGKTLVFAGADGNLYRRDASGAGKEELLLKSPNPKRPSDWSRDGRFLIYTEVDPRTQGDIWVLPNPGGKAGGSKPYPFEQTAANEGQAQLSPDGRWLAYTALGNVAQSVYVRPFPSGEGLWRVGGFGQTPRWRSDGRELFYVSISLQGMRFMAVPVAAGNSAFTMGAPVALFSQRTTLRTVDSSEFPYAVSANGQHFFVLVPPPQEETIHLLTNWTAQFAGSRGQP